MNQRIESLAQKQQEISNGQEEKNRTLAGLKARILQEIKHNLEAVTDTVKEVWENVPSQALTGDNYAERAARTRRADTNPEKSITNYFDMERKASKHHPAATTTNGTLDRVYIRYWRREPVGAVKRALRVAIGTWNHQNNMDDEEDTTNEPSPDIDAVRHLNQFGTPEAPLMEVARTQERKVVVVQFFKERNIETWPDTINQLLTPEIYPNDKSLTADRRHTGHCGRVLNVW